MQYDIYSLKLDYNKNFSSGNKWEGGFKVSSVSSDNDFRVWVPEGYQLPAGRDFSNHFRYKERILAGYLIGSYTLNPLFDLQAALRAEQTSAEGLSFNLGQQNNRSYLDLFPSFTINQRVDSNYQISYSYSRRINRPSYGSLNPFVIYADPYTFIQGNPNLQPEYAQVFEMNHVLFQDYRISLNYTRVQDGIVQVPFGYEEERTTTFKLVNLSRSQDASVSALISLELSRWWHASNTLTYSSFKSQLEGYKVDNSGFNANLQTQQKFSLPGSLSLEVSGTYVSAQRWGVLHLKAWGWVEAGVKKKQC